MDAIIMAAGLGTRLRPHTLTTPKPLLPIRGRPILDWALGALPPEVDRVLVVVNYLAEQIEAYLRTQKRFARWEVVRQAQPRGTGDAVRSCQERVESERFLVLNGDDLYGAADLAALAEKPAGILAHPVDDARKWGVVTPKANDPGLMEKLEEKPDRDGSALANIGAYVFPRTVFDIPLTLSKRNEYEITEAVDVLAKRAPFHLVLATFWFPIGTIEQWQAAQTADLSKAKR
jgi:bifunctional UDP-N-acetylglucosamine pyrophosphorylase/glucosamine-1-phosphate N-acetyltransferase